MQEVAKTEITTAVRMRGDVSRSGVANASQAAVDGTDNFEMTLRDSLGAGSPVAMDNAKVAEPRAGVMQDVAGNAVAGTDAVAGSGQQDDNYQVAKSTMPTLQLTDVNKVEVKHGMEQFRGAFQGKKKLASVGQEGSSEGAAVSAAATPRGESLMSVPVAVAEGLGNVPDQSEPETVEATNEGPELKSASPKKLAAVQYMASAKGSTAAVLPVADTSAEDLMANGSASPGSGLSHAPEKAEQDLLTAVAKRESGSEVPGLSAVHGASAVARGYAEVGTQSGAFHDSKQMALQTLPQTASQIRGEQELGESVHQGVAPRMLLVTPSSLEVGVPSGCHGWLKVRAELTDGVVTAHLSSATPVGEAMLHREIGALKAYLQEERVALKSVSIDSKNDASAQLLDRSPSGGSDAKEGPRKYGDDGSREGLPDGRVSPDCAIHESVGSWISPAVFAGGGTWLSVRA